VQAYGQPKKKKKKPRNCSRGLREFSEHDAAGHAEGKKKEKKREKRREKDSRRHRIPAATCQSLPPRMKPSVSFHDRVAHRKEGNERGKRKGETAAGVRSVGPVR